MDWEKVFYIREWKNLKETNNGIGMGFYWDWSFPRDVIIRENARIYRYFREYGLSSFSIETIKKERI
jgi:hypothetical protein